MLSFLIFFFKQKTAYEMRISDWSSDVCSSDLRAMAVAVIRHRRLMHVGLHGGVRYRHVIGVVMHRCLLKVMQGAAIGDRAGVAGQRQQRDQDPQNEGGKRLHGRSITRRGGHDKLKSGPDFFWAQALY